MPRSACRRRWIMTREEVVVRWIELSGYVASSLVFLTFYMRGMASLRLMALCSNAAFLVYAGSLHLLPILLLHGALIPVNVCRLRAAWRSEDRPRSPSATVPSEIDSLAYRASTEDDSGVPEAATIAVPPPTVPPDSGARRKPSGLRAGLQVIVKPFRVTGRDENKTLDRGALQSAKPLGRKLLDQHVSAIGIPEG
jgi:hypothetical protein